VGRKVLFRSLGQVRAATTSHADWGHETCSGSANGTIDAVCQRPTPIGGARTTRGARVGRRWGGGDGARRAMRGGMGGELPPTAGARRRAGAFNTPPLHDVPVSRTPKRPGRASGGACRSGGRRCTQRDLAPTRHGRKIGEGQRRSSVCALRTRHTPTSHRLRVSAPVNKHSKV
jgi:hypothetical protein